MSAYEDKALGLSENGEVFGGIKNKTFPEFIDHILREWKFHSCNEHWRPYYMHCDYCDINYTMIGRMEDMENDLKYLAHKNYPTLTSSFPSLRPFPPPTGGTS